jgi:PAS domain-containing protein
MGEIASDGDVAKQLLAFVEATTDLVGVVDEESRVQYLNEAARKRLGLPGTERSLCCPAPATSCRS